MSYLCDSCGKNVEKVFSCDFCGATVCRPCLKEFGCKICGGVRKV